MLKNDPVFTKPTCSYGETVSHIILAPNIKTRQGSHGLCTSPELRNPAVITKLCVTEINLFEILSQFQQGCVLNRSGLGKKVNKKKKVKGTISHHQEQDGNGCI